MDVDLDSYAHHLDAGAMRRIFHYGHFIPVRRGFTKAFVDRHYPGWTWNALMDLLEGAGVAHRRPGVSPHPLWAPDRLVESVHVNSPSDYCIVWIDGTVTVR
ncbi:hypothetical protein GCM10009821_20320 [Aeromicrobium halocynthiae]|uniref:Uncharacterized protein n=1 Tax=Aeromicrobium halocynthiae TaxID=560557 RepID=A0ABN2W0Y2_9ACTN